MLAEPVGEVAVDGGGQRPYRVAEDVERPPRQARAADGSSGALASAIVAESRTRRCRTSGPSARLVGLPDASAERAAAMCLPGCSPPPAVSAGSVERRTSSSRPVARRSRAADRGLSASAFERSLVRLLGTLPGWLEPCWQIAYDSLALLAVALVVAALVGRRSLVLLQTAASVALAAGITLVSARLGVGRWPDLDNARAARRRRVDVPRPAGRARRHRRPRGRPPPRPSAPATRALGAAARHARCRSRRSGRAERHRRGAPRLAGRRHHRPARTRHLGRAPGHGRRRGDPRRARPRGGAARAGGQAAGGASSPAGCRPTAIRSS